MRDKDETGLFTVSDKIHPLWVIASACVTSKNINSRTFKSVYWVKIMSTRAAAKIGVLFPGNTSSYFHLVQAFGNYQYCDPNLMSELTNLKLIIDPKLI